MTTAIPLASILENSIPYLMNQPDIQIVIVWVATPDRHLQQRHVRTVARTGTSSTTKVGKCLVICGLVHRTSKEELAEEAIYVFDAPEYIFSALGLVMANPTQIRADAPDGGLGQSVQSLAPKSAELVTGIPAQQFVEKSGISFAPTRAPWWRSKGRLPRGASRCSDLSKDRWRRARSQVGSRTCHWSTRGWRRDPTGVE